jgi:hypothetical protein
MSFRLPDVLRRHHSTIMRYSQVKAVTFEINIKVTALTATFYSLVVLLFCGLLDNYFKTRNNFPVGFPILVPTTSFFTLSVIRR